MSPDIVLDLSRLLSRVRHHTPSGVDRVEMAYARGLHGRFGSQLHFGAVHPFGMYGRLSTTRALRFLDAMEERWKNEDGNVGRRPLSHILPTLLGLLPDAPPPVAPGDASRIYVQASPHHLTSASRVRRILKKEHGRFLCLVHDLIPIEYPEYARPNGAHLHQKRIETIASLADSIIVNSTATGESLRPWLRKEGRDVNVRVALLGTHDTPWKPRPTPAASAPYFVCIGTIEPRKNHLLLLNLWRHMAETQPGDTIPHLVIVGRRGWENEQVVDMLERCPALQGHVEELNGCSDRRMYELLTGARALLLPAFAEGYGMPVAEALAVGTAVICSDLPALREAGGDGPDYLDPLDGPGWKASILDHHNGGPLHTAQKERLSNWRAPTWSAHIDIVCDEIDAVRSQRSAGTKPRERCLGPT